MKIKMCESPKGCWNADIMMLPGSPPIGRGPTREAAVADLMIGLSCSGYNLMNFIEIDENFKIEFIDPEPEIEEVELYFQMHDGDDFVLVTHNRQKHDNVLHCLPSYRMCFKADRIINLKTGEAIKNRWPFDEFGLFCAIVRSKAAQRVTPDEWLRTKADEKDRRIIRRMKEIS